ncbi:MAG: helix-turn-helix domain-containing protein [Gemmatimonadota bacterium]
MILLSVSDPTVRLAISRCARPDEAVVGEVRWVQAALDHGYPRVHVRDDQPRRSIADRSERVPELHVSREMLAGWDQDRRKVEVPQPRIEYLARRLGSVVSEVALEGTWVDRSLADLTRAAGGPLPLSFRAFTRHTLELPCRYTDLSAIAEAAGLSRGALKARFRRKGLDSPFTYLRWLRSFAVAERLVDPDVTVAMAARELGFTSDTNMCRMVKILTGATPGSLRDPGVRRRLRLAFVREHLTRGALEGWSRLERIFRDRRAA